MDTWGRPAECGRGHQEPREALPALPNLEDTSATSTAWIWGRAGRAEKGHSLHCTQGTGARTAPHRAAAVPPNAAQEEPPAQRRAHRCVPQTRVAGVLPLFPESQEYRRGRSLVLQGDPPQPGTQLWPAAQAGMLQGEQLACHSVMSNVTCES